MKNPLEQTCESYFIELLKTNAILAVLDIRHFEDDDSAKPGLVVEAIQGAHRLDGPKAYDVKVTVFNRRTTTTASDNEKIMDAISETIFSATAGQAPTSEAMFSYLLLKDDMAGSRTNTKDLRKRDKTFSIMAKMKDL